MIQSTFACEACADESLIRMQENYYDPFECVGCSDEALYPETHVLDRWCSKGVGFWNKPSSNMCNFPSGMKCRPLCKNFFVGFPTIRNIKVLFGKTFFRPVSSPGWTGYRDGSVVVTGQKWAH